MPFDSTVGTNTCLLARPQRYCLVILAYDMLEQEGRRIQRLRARGSVLNIAGAKKDDIMQIITSKSRYK